MSKVQASFRKFENLHIVLWLIKDFFWISDLKILGMFMILPTLGVAIYLSFLSKLVSSDFWHNVAITCWIAANSVWMYGEFYLDDSTRKQAKLFFALGFLALLYHYIINEPFWKKVNSKLS